MRRALAAVVGLLAIAGAFARSAEAAPVRIDVRNNSYEPAEVRVAHGATVSWMLREGNHTVTSDVKGFDSGAMTSGKPFSFTAPARDITLYYHCRVHGAAGDGKRWGSGMVGRIIVGAGSPEPPTPRDVQVRPVPSKQWPSFAGALRDLRPDERYRVDLAPGTYRGVDLTPASLGFRERPAPRFELTIRGLGARPRDVFFTGGETGLSLSVDGVHLQNVAFRAQRFAGVFVRDVDRWSIDDVVIERTGRYGVWLDGATHGRVRRVSVSGGSVAGVAIGGCDECDVIVDSVTVAGSRQGLVGTGAGSLVVRGSTFTGNGVGIALRSDGVGGTAHRGAHLYLNTFRDNTRTHEAGAGDVASDLPVGAGIWIDGGGFDVIERNDFAGHSYGVVLTGPSFDSRIDDNVSSGASEADVAWDGIGKGVCLEGNLAPDGSPATSMPPAAEVLYGCDLPATAGIPFPLVTATVLAWGLGVRG